jgi:hypothetical protein
MSDWSLINGDPAPGDPGTIRTQARKLDTTADSIREVSQALSRIARGSDDAAWRGESADAMREVLDEFRYELQPVATSFDAVGGALGRYARDLEDLQNRARQALQRAQAAESRRKQAESSKRHAADVLAGQRRQLSDRKNQQRSHAITSAGATLIDPASAEANARESQRLARETTRAATAAADAERTVQRCQAQIDEAVHDLDHQRAVTRDIKAEWDQRSRQAANEVESSLHSSLRNASNLEKLGQKLEGALIAIGNFLADPLPYIAKLREIISKLSDLVSMVSLALVGLAALAGMLGLAPVAAVLVAAAAVVVVVAMGLAAAKLVTGMILWGNRYTENGQEVVGTSNLFGDMFGLAVSAVPFLRGSAKTIQGVGTSAKAIEKARLVNINDARRQITLLIGGPVDVAKQAIKDYGDLGWEVIEHEGAKAIEEQISSGFSGVSGDLQRIRHQVEVMLPVPVGSQVRQDGNR